MRKAGRAGLWVIAMACLSAPAVAQEDEPRLAHSRVESDPKLMASYEAWQGAWRTNIEAHLRTVAARGTPRDLLVAGWLWPMETDETIVQRQGTASRPQARAWIQAAYDSARGEDALVDWALPDACRMTGATCDRGMLLQRQLSADPGNAEVLLAAHYAALQREDAVDAERLWQAAAAATHYRSRGNDVGTLMLSTLRRVPAPPLDAALAAAIGEDLALGRGATTQDMADTAAVALNAVIALPTLDPITRRCSPQVGSLSAAAFSDCKRIYALLAADESLLLSAMVALPRLVEWANSDAEREAARERLRRFAWVYERLRHLYPPFMEEQKVPDDYVDRLFLEGEFAALRRRLEINGIATAPPAGWLPENTKWRALLTATPVPAAR